MDANEISRPRLSRHQSRPRHGARAAATPDASRRWSGTRTPGFPRAPIWSSFPAVSPMAIICAAARWPRGRRSWRGARRRAERRPRARASATVFRSLRDGAFARRAHAQRAASLHLPRRVSAGRALGYGFYARLQSRPGDPVPVAHGEGNYIADGETIARLEGEGRVRVSLFVAGRHDRPELESQWRAQAIAGIINERGNVLGMMPHPENHVEAADGPAPTGGACSPGWWIISSARRDFANVARHHA